MRCRRGTCQPGGLAVPSSDSHETQTPLGRSSDVFNGIGEPARYPFETQPEREER